MKTIIILLIIKTLLSTKFNLEYKEINKSEYNKLGSFNFNDLSLISNDEISLLNKDFFEINKKYIIKIISVNSNEEYYALYSRLKDTKSISIEINFTKNNEILNFTFLNSNKIYKENRKKIDYYFKLNYYKENLNTDSTDPFISTTVNTNINSKTNDELNYYEDNNINNIEEGSTTNNNNNDKEEESFFKKYFWYIAIGGMIIFNIASFDKKKLMEKYEEAKAMQEGKLNQNK